MTEAVCYAPTTPPAADSASASRAHQAFPPLVPEQIERLLPIRERRTWRDGELMFESGKLGPGMFILLRSQMEVTRCNWLGNELPVVTQRREAGWQEARKPFALETSIAAVFAIGDMRSGSVKRAAAAVGEGAAVVAQLHAHLAARVTSRRDDTMPR